MRSCYLLLWDGYVIGHVTTEKLLLATVGWLCNRVIPVYMVM